MQTSIALDHSHPFLDGKPKRMLINGSWVDAASGKTFTSYNPSTGKVLAEVALGDAEDINRAVLAARAAFNSGWPKTRPFDRQRILLKWAELIEKHYDELARLDTLDYGGSINRSLGKKDRHLGLLRFYAGAIVSIHGETVENSMQTEALTLTLKEPIGVVGGIFGWNAPMDMMIWKIAPAIATGCTIVMKPPTEAALSSLRMGELLQEAGVPNGVVNIVPGGGPCGAALAEHPDVDKITFTGSTSTGQAIMRAAAGNLKKLSLELGGKSPNIIFADADLDAAVQSAAFSIFNNAGQVCAAGSRLYLERSIHDEFVHRLVQEGKKLRVGDSLDPSNDMGPVVSARQQDRVKGYLDSGHAEGATALLGGDLLRGPEYDAGYFVQPTIFSNVTHDMRIVNEEIFGPVACVMPFDSIDEVIAKGNDTTYGLASGVWTRDINKALHVTRALRAGSVWVNCYLQLDPAMPFGGYKMSGQGRESGLQHLDSYLETKAVTLRINI